MLASSPCSSERRTSTATRKSSEKTCWLSVSLLPVSTCTGCSRRLISRPLLQMQVRRIKLGDTDQFIPRLDDQRVVTQCDQALAAHLLQHPVHVHVRQTQRVTEFNLRQWQGIAVLTGKPHSL